MGHLNLQKENKVKRMETKEMYSHLKGERGYLNNSWPKPRLMKCIYLTTA